MDFKKFRYHAVKVFVTLILLYIGAMGILGSLGLLGLLGRLRGGTLFDAILPLGIFLTSSLFLAMGVLHYRNSVTTLLKTTMAVFGLFILLPILFASIVFLNIGLMSFVASFLFFISIFVVPLGLLYISNKMTLKLTV